MGEVAGRRKRVGEGEIGVNFGRRREDQQWREGEGEEEEKWGVKVKCGEEG